MDPLAGGVEDAGLARSWGLPAVWRFASVGSTNDIARALGDAGAEAGTAVVADEQHRGRGRSGDPWISTAGLGAWLSVVCHPPRGGEPGLLPLRVGLAAAGALDRWLPGPGAGIRWPNDLLWQGRKLAGVLCEAAGGQDGPARLIAGVGVNVRHTAEDFPVDLRGIATSLRLASFASVPTVLEVAGAVAVAVARAMAGGAGVHLPGDMADRDVLLGREVRVSLGSPAEASLVGRAMGVAPDGALLVRTEDGVLRRVYAGSARPLDEAHTSALHLEPLPTVS